MDYLKENGVERRVLIISGFGIFRNGLLACCMSSTLHSPRYQVFRQLLVDARERAGMTQVQIAGVLKKQQSFVSKYENGERRLDFTEFIEIAEVLGIDIDEFIKTYRSSIRTSKRR